MAKIANLLFEVKWSWWGKPALLATCLLPRVWRGYAISFIVDRACRVRELR